MDKWKIAFCLCLFVQFSHAFVPGDELEGPNVCKRIVSQNVTVVVTHMIPYQESRIEWCPAIPPRCKKTVTKFRAENRTEIIEKTQAIRECCDGYIENEQSNRCIPHCQQSCGDNGTCISPNNCKCDSGFAGPSCDISCPPGRFGKNCKKKCDCANGASCDPYDGSCNCLEGFNGVKCENTSKVPLNVLCNAGWTGEFCNEPCSDELWEINCQNICKCQNKSKCRKYDGQCLCEFGFTGDFCEQKCPDGFYGNGCIETCNCPNDSNFQCHYAYGCICADGFSGLSCEELNEK